MEAKRKAPSRTLYDAIEQLRLAAERRRQLTRGTPEYDRAATEEERLNADVMDLARERNRIELGN